MYDATIGRWLSEDPLGFEAGDENLYRYVANNPTNATDASGLQLPPDVWYPVAQSEYRRAFADVRGVLDDIDFLVSNPAGYYDQSGLTPGIVSLLMTLGNRLGTMQSAAMNLHEAGVAQFRESFDAGDIVAAFGPPEQPGGRAKQIIDDIDTFIEDYDVIYYRLERAWYDSIGVDLGYYNTWDRSCLQMGNPLEFSGITPDNNYRMWISVRQLTLQELEQQYQIAMSLQGP